MKITKPLVLAPLILLFALTMASGQKQKPSNDAEAAPKIGVIKKSLVDGCGCRLQLPEDYRKHNRRAVFLHDFGDTIQMNIDGKDVRLKLVSETPRPKKQRVGSHKKEVYSAGKDKVEIDYTVTKLCSPKDESCEAVWYSATITVIRGKQSQQIAVLGLCGC